MQSSDSSNTAISRSRRRTFHKDDGEYKDAFIGRETDLLGSKYDAIEAILQALTAYTAPPSVASSWSGTQSMESANATSGHLTCLLDNHNLANVGKNANVARSFIEGRGVRPINVYRGLSVDGVSGMIMTECCSPRCSSKTSLLEARSKYKSCHHCYTYYCSGKCRLVDWKDHKMRKCPLGRAVSAAKSVVRRILSDENCHNTFSNLGRGGYLRMGRGCIVVWFNSCADAETFSETGIRNLKNCPVFVCIRNIHTLIRSMAPNSLSSIHEACTSYDPEKTMVVSVSISIDNALLKQCTAQMRHTKVHAVKKCLTISLSRFFLDSLSAHRLNDSLRPTSLLLTMLPNQQCQDSLDYDERQVVFVHILRQLEARGVDLRLQYPQLYRNLAQFVENNSSFSPTTIYPTDPSTGRAFVCMIAPMSDPINAGNEYRNEHSNRSSLGSFMAELEAVIPNWENAEITDL